MNVKQENQEKQVKPNINKHKPVRTSKLSKMKQDTFVILSHFLNDKSIDSYLNKIFK